MDPSSPADNPFTPPSAEIDAPAPGGEPLFSPHQMGAASFFGSPLAGVLLMRANYRALGDARLARRALVVGLLSCVVLIAGVSLLPDRVPGTPINIVAALVFQQLATALQGGAYQAHLARGGARRSNWLVLGVVVACVAVLGAVLLAAAALAGAE